MQEPGQRLWEEGLLELLAQEGGADLDSLPAPVGGAGASAQRWTAGRRRGHPAAVRGRRPRRCRPGARGACGGRVVNRAEVLTGPAMRVSSRSRDAERERSWPLTRVFAVGAALAAVIVLAVVGSGSYALWRLVEARSVASQVGAPGLLNGQQLTTALVNEESGVRGFAVTGRPEFLEPYYGGLEDERRATAVLHDLDPRGLVDFGPALDEVERATLQWRVSYADPVLAGSTPPPPPELGKALFDRVRVENAQLVAQLEEQRNNATASTDAAVRFLVAVAVAIAVGLIAFVVATGSACAERCCARSPISPRRSARWCPGACTGRSGRPARARSSSSAATSTRCARTSCATWTRRRRPTGGSTSRHGSWSAPTATWNSSPRRQPRPAGAAAQGVELLPAAAAPLRRQARRARRPVHRVRRRRRAADAAADQRPAVVLPRRPHHQGFDGRPRHGGRLRRHPAGDPARGGRRHDRGLPADLDRAADLLARVSSWVAA